MEETSSHRGPAYEPDGKCRPNLDKHEPRQVTGHGLYQGHSPFGWLPAGIQGAVPAYRAPDSNKASGTL